MLYRMLQKSSKKLLKKETDGVGKEQGTLVSVLDLKFTFAAPSTFLLIRWSGEYESEDVTNDWNISFADMDDIQMKSMQYWL